MIEAGYVMLDSEDYINVTPLGEDAYWETVEALTRQSIAALESEIEQLRARKDKASSYLGAVRRRRHDVISRQVR